MAAEGRTDRRRTMTGVPVDLWSTVAKRCSPTQQGISSMKCTRALAAVVALLGSAMLAAPAMAEGPRPTPWSVTSKVKIAYEEPTSDAFRPVYQRLKELQVLERLQRFLAPLRLTRDL